MDDTTDCCASPLSDTSLALTLTHPVICVVGPTATGKSELAQMLAEHLDGEVVSADSMQIYKGMDIGTGKVKECERRVTHHGLDLVEPGTAFSAALYQDYARKCFEDINERGKRIILAGGTGLYVRAAIDDYHFPRGEQVENSVRETYMRYAQEHGEDALWQLLLERDPESARVIHPHNVRRVVRAFELLECGQSYAVQKENLAHISQAVPAVFVGITIKPALLVKRIDARIDAMFEEGLVDEVKSLLDKGLRLGITAPQAIGYKEIVTYLDGQCSLDEARERIQIATHRYAKRQRSWFRRDKRINWIDASDLTMDEVFRHAIAYCEKNNSV